jgi:hypothetical protein
MLPWWLPLACTRLPVLDGPRGEGVNAWAFQVDSASDTVSIRCEGAGEVHELSASPELEIPLYGLLADTAYDCTVSDDEEQAELSFQTRPIPSRIPTWDVTVPGDADGDYTLLNQATDIATDRQAKLLLLDPEGRLRWFVDIPYQPPEIDAQYLGDGEWLYGGNSAPPTRIDLDGDIRREASVASSLLGWHHHVEQVPSGEVWALVHERNHDRAQSWDGFGIDRLDETMSELQWTWSSQRGVDEGWLAIPEAADDPYHANALVLEEDAVWVNLRHQSRLVKLDLTGALQWSMGINQDFTLLEADGSPADFSRWFFGQHAPEWDGERLLMYDNGMKRPGGSYSRALQLRVDEAARTLQIDWEFTEPGWFESAWGDVDRLEDGDILILRGHCERCGSRGRTEVIEVEPDTGEVVWRITFDDPHVTSYRAQRIDGCALFDNLEYCPR